MSKALVIKSANFSTNRVEQITLQNIVYCTGITLNKSNITSNEIDVTEALVATVTPVDCTEQVTWQTSDATVATVSNGTVTIVGLGTATITATCGNYSATCNVTANDVTVDSGFTFAFVSNTNGLDYAQFSAPYYNRISFADRVDKNSSRLRLSVGSVTTDYYLAPHVFPHGTNKINVYSSGLNNDYSCYVFFFSSNEVSSAAKCAKMIEKFTQDATNHVIDYTIDVPDGADSFVAMVYANTTYTEADDVDTVAANIGYEITYKHVE